MHLQDTLVQDLELLAGSSSGGATRPGPKLKEWPAFMNFMSRAFSKHEHTYLGTVGGNRKNKEGRTKKEGLEDSRGIEKMKDTKHIEKMS